MFGRLQTNKRRRVILLSIILLLSVPVIQAQNIRSLEPGGSITGTLDSENVAQMYTFTGSVDDVVSLSATSSTGLGLALLVADSSGETLAQGFESSSPTTLAEITLPASDTYYVTVLSAMGVTLPPGSTFDLSFDIELAELAGTVEPTPVVLPTQASSGVTTPGQILTTQGLEVSLSWASLANMDLEVRDPVGGSVFFSTPTTPSGGQFGVNVNSGCDTRSADAPTESAAWPGGALPTGSYEILVYYQPLDNCPTTDPANFTVDVTLDGQALDTVSANILPNETFISSFIVEADGGLDAGPSGLYTDPTILPAPAADLLSSAQPLQRDVPVNGTLNRANFFETYRFQGSANDLITINLNAQSGSLDTLLLLLDSAGNVLTNNDDVGQGNTNSSVANFRLLRDDDYTIVATRYGKEVGGTEGDYTLLLTGPTGDLPAEVLNLGLPRGAVEIALSWNTNADLQLLVRDPRGDSIFDDSPQVPSNGRLAASGNVNCTIAPTSPVSYVYWPEGTLIPGLYEVEVWHQNACNDTTPVTFSLNILVNGAPIFSQTAQPESNQVYLTSFVIGVDQQVQTSEGGFIGTRQQGGGSQLDSTSLDFRSGLASAQTLVSGQAASGSIVFDDKFDLYRFEGEAGDIVTISMVATAGRLDTVLFLLDPNGFQIADNDDAVVGESTDSLISEFTLPQDGIYTIIATHFGMQFGGTTGAYDLVFSRLN